MFGSRTGESGSELPMRRECGPLDLGMTPRFGAIRKILGAQVTQARALDRLHRNGNAASLPASHMQDKAWRKRL